MPKVYTEGSMIRVFDDADICISNGLEPKIYNIELHPKMGVYLKERPSVFENKKIYGRINNDRDRILKTFDDREVNMGVLLSGLPGSSKTTLSRQLTKSFIRERKQPVIIIDTPVDLLDLARLLNSLNQTCLVIIDEFEKNYKSTYDDGNEDDRKSQIGILALLDGQQSIMQKCLFILICNDTYLINRHLLSRPGRIYYHFKYGTVDQETIKEYCLEKLNDKASTDEILRIAAMSEIFTFDSLQALVEECNRYRCSPTDALEGLNINMFSDSNCKLQIVITDTQTGNVFVVYEHISYHNLYMNSFRITVDEDDLIEAGEQYSDQDPGIANRLTLSMDSHNLQVVSDIVHGKIYQFGLIQNRYDVHAFKTEGNADISMSTRLKVSSKRSINKIIKKLGVN